MILSLSTVRGVEETLRTGFDSPIVFIFIWLKYSKLCIQLILRSDRHCFILQSTYAVQCIVRFSYVCFVSAQVGRGVKTCSSHLFVHIRTHKRICACTYIHTSTPRVDGIGGCQQIAVTLFAHGTFACVSKVMLITLVACVRSFKCNVIYFQVRACVVSSVHEMNGPLMRFRIVS